MITNGRSLPVLSTACLMVLLAASSERVCNAQEADHSHDAHHRAALHFSHPLVAESPSADTKIRFDYPSEDLTGDEGERHTLRLEGEYALKRWISLELELDIQTSPIDGRTASPNGPGCTPGERGVVQSSENSDRRRSMI